MYVYIYVYNMCILYVYNTIDNSISKNNKFVR